MKKLLTIIIGLFLMIGIGCDTNPPLDFGKVLQVVKYDGGCRCLVEFTYKGSHYEGLVDRKEVISNDIWTKLWIECPDSIKVNDWVDFKFEDNR